MGRQLRVEYPDAHYHVTSRGNERKDVFKSQKDREQFLHYLELNCCPSRAKMYPTMQEHPTP